MSSLSLLPPQLRALAEDSAVFTSEPFASVFKSCLAGQHRKSVDFLLKNLDETLGQPFYRELLDDWLVFTLGYVVVKEMPLEAVIKTRRLFLEVLFYRYQSYVSGQLATEELALQALYQAQMSTVREHVRCLSQAHIPSDFNWEREIDETECGIQDFDGSDASSDWEDVDEDTAKAIEVAGGEPLSDDEVYNYNDDESCDGNYIPSDQSDDEQGPVQEPQPTFSKPHRTRGVAREATAAAKVSVSAPPIEPLISASSEHCILSQWAENIRDFFDSPVRIAMKRDCWPVVLDLVEMRKLASSMLLDLMREVARPGNMLETTHPDVELSFRFHDWRLSYSELICRWIKPTLTEEEYQQAAPRLDPNYRFTAEDADDLLILIRDNPSMQPWSFNPMANMDGWNTEIVYRQLKAHPVFRDPAALRDFSEGAVDSRFPTVVRETAEYDLFIAEVKAELYRPPPPAVSAATSSIESDEDETDSEGDASVGGSGAYKRKRKRPPKLSPNVKRRLARKGFKPSVEELEDSAGGADTLAQCPHCKSLPANQQCFRRLYVKRRQCLDLIGGALTSAPEHDRLNPKASGGREPPPIKYYHPYRDLKMRLVKFRKNVYDRCGKDITQFVWKRRDGREEIVGGVRFKPFSDKTLARLLHNHRLVLVRGIRRRDIMQWWSYGSMTATGSRQPNGGLKGDGYRAYACHRGDTPDDIKATVREGSDADVVIEAANTIVPGLKTELANLTRESSLNQLGRSGVTNFTCTNYISPIHADADLSLADVLEGRGRQSGLGGLTPCVQLKKSGCGPHDYNFGYLRWGVIVRTMTNAVWYVVFNGRHEHGTDIPRRSVVGKAQSIGRHQTAPARNVERGTRIREIRHGYNLRSG
ncbi:hypothetical protein R3P38DRAFT_2501047 [Favolaschia claudopus]|uniref:Transposase n=1 Tax=Favolaschia claudopus TaxID=2862362 RepID=A0AAW0DRF9_9AGAR